MHLLGPLLLALGAPQDAGDAVPFRVIEENNMSGFNSGMTKLITSTPDWVAVWMERQRNLQTKRLHPEIDFDRDVVIAVAMGQKKTGGYSVDITRVIRTKDDIRIYLKKTAPPDDAKLPAVVTSPFIFARMKKPDRPVVFLDEPKK